jgi:hypothetical protein
LNDDESNDNLTCEQGTKLWRNAIYLINNQTKQARILSPPHHVTCDGWNERSLRPQRALVVYNNDTWELVIVTVSPHNLVREKFFTEVEILFFVSRVL